MPCIARSTIAVGFLLLVGRAHASDHPKIQFDQKSAQHVDVAGLDAADLAAIRKVGLQADGWSQLFAVYVVPAVGKQPGPAILGSYRIDGELLRFEPRFPFMPGVGYRAVFTPSRLSNRAAGNESAISLEFSLPKPKTEAARVTHVYPSADRLPENLLRFYLVFSAPMERGGIYRHIKLLDDKGKAVDVPFLELDEELWDEAHQRLTLLCDPGRIKRGLKPREEDGPVLEEGKDYTLVIDTGLLDANGNHLREPFRKSFRAIAPDDTQPDPKTWKVQAPAAGTREPLTVTIPKPLDHALLERLVWVTDQTGRKLAGTVTLERDETVWVFTPRTDWTAGQYQLVADTRLEDPAGNSIARPFEVDVFRPVQREVKSDTVRVPFAVKSADRH